MYNLKGRKFESLSVGETFLFFLSWAAVIATAGGLILSMILLPINLITSNIQEGPAAVLVGIWGIISVCALLTLIIKIVIYFED